MGFREKLLNLPRSVITFQILAIVSALAYIIALIGGGLLTAYYLAMIAIGICVVSALFTLIKKIPILAGVDISAAIIIFWNFISLAP